MVPIFILLLVTLFFSFSGCSLNCGFTAAIVATI